MSGTINIPTCCAITWSLIVFFVFLVAPVAAEIILFAYGSHYWPSMASTAFLTAWAFFAGVRFFTEKARGHPDFGQRNVFACNPSDIRTLVSSEYFVYGAPVWYGFNAVASAITLNSIPWIPVAAFLLPPLTMLLGGVIGYGIKEGKREAARESLISVKTIN